MKDYSANIIRSILINLLGKERIQQLILRLAHVSRIDLWSLAYWDSGILKYQDHYVSGERFVIAKILKQLIKAPNAVLVDVGANVGVYSKELRATFHAAQIYAIEPNSKAFALMCSNLHGLDIHCFNVGFSSSRATYPMYTHMSDQTSPLTSIYSQAFTDLFKSTNLVVIESEFITIDEFCSTNGIEKIDFLKIDTEGHEIEVLSGAKIMLTNGRIDIVQFEFNEMNVISRVFLRDFYQLLVGYAFYRVDTQRLIPLGEYDPRNEIFKFQNILAINGRLGYEVPIR